MKILKKVTRKNILYIITFIIVALLPIIKQGSFYLQKYSFIKSYDEINPAYILYASIPFLIFVYIKNLIKTKRELDIYDYLFYFLTVIGIIATVFSMDKEISLFGKDFRHEGFLSILSYYLLFINWKVEGNKKDIRNFIKLLVIVGIFNSIYALFQIYTPFKFVLRYGKDMEMASGICGNPNFFGSLIVTIISIVTLKFLTDKKVSIKTIIVLILLFISIINSQSTGPLLTYIITIIFIIIYLFIKKKIINKNILYLVIILLITFISTYFINQYVYTLERCEMCDLKESIQNNNKINNKTSIDNGRIEIWKNSLNIVKKNWFDGVGYDNFYLAYYEGVNLTEVDFISIEGQLQAVPMYYEIVDNSHNVYLQTLISTGIIGLIPYLILCLYTFIRGLKTNDKLVMMLLSGFVAYSIQAFANISVIQVAPIYYIIIGLILSIKQ